MNKKILGIVLISIILINAGLRLDVFKASWYGGHHHGKLTASGKVFNKKGMTCAANSNYKLGDTLDVTNIKNNKCVTVVVTDRGGFSKYGRTLDLSEGAFSKIADIKDGVINITIKKINE